MKDPKFQVCFQVFFVHFEFDLQEGEKKFQTIILVDYVWQVLEFLFLNCNLCVNLSSCFFFAFLESNWWFKYCTFHVFLLNVFWRWLCSAKKEYSNFLRVNKTCFFEVFHDAVFFAKKKKREAKLCATKIGLQWKIKFVTSFCLVLLCIKKSFFSSLIKTQLFQPQKKKKRKLSCSTFS